MSRQGSPEEGLPEDAKKLDGPVNLTEAPSTPPDGVPSESLKGVSISDIKQYIDEAGPAASSSEEESDSDTAEGAANGNGKRQAPMKFIIGRVIRKEASGRALVLIRGYIRAK